MVLIPFADHYGRYKMNVFFLAAETSSMWIFLGGMVIFN
jgi:hypothetical protein